VAKSAWHVPVPDGAAALFDRAVALDTPAIGRGGGTGRSEAQRKQTAKL
jgi:hypothetical protein